MLCFSCNRETPDTELYCRNCGVKLDFTFDQVKDQMSQTIRQERVAETKDFSTWLLNIMLFFLLFSLFFNSLWEEPEDINLSPGYAPELNFEASIKNIHAPIIIEKRK